MCISSVIPAKVGATLAVAHRVGTSPTPTRQRLLRWNIATVCITDAGYLLWIPACAGMTGNTVHRIFTEESIEILRRCAPQNDMRGHS